MSEFPAKDKALQFINLAKDTARMIDSHSGAWAEAGDVIDYYGRAGVAFKELLAVLPKDERDQWRPVFSELTRRYILWNFEQFGVDEECG